MPVVLVAQYFPPETGGPPNRAASLARGIRAAGHEVCVLTEKPSHPEGRIHPEYRGGFAARRIWEDVPVLYVWVFATPRKVFWARVANHVSFMLAAFVGSLRLRGRFDVVLTTSPPLFAGVAGWAIARTRRAAHVLDVRDLWPDVAVALGELRNPVSIRLSKRLERALYHSAAAVTAVTASFCETIAASLASPDKVHLVRNGSHPGLFGGRGDAIDARRRLGIADGGNRFVVAYVGNLGIAQGLDHVVEAARLLSAASPPVDFVLVGSGPVEPRLRQNAARWGLANLHFFPRVDQDQAAEWMAAADALIVCLADIELLQQFVPSKLYDALAAARPVLLGARGEAREILDTSGGGIAYQPESAPELADAVRRLSTDRDLGRRLGRHGAAFAREHCDREHHARLMVRLLESVQHARRSDQARPGAPSSAWPRIPSIPSRSAAKSRARDAQLRRTR